MLYSPLHAYPSTVDGIPMKFVLSAIVAGIVALAPAIGSAQTSALTFTSGTGSSGLTNNQTVGWQFNVTSGFTVNALSWYDSGGDGLGQSYQVGIWSPDGTLLTSATVPSGTSGSLLDGFRTVSISDLFLDVGNGYIVGGLNSAQSTDALLFDVSGLATASGIEFVDATFSDFDLGFVRPTQFSVAETGFFGPSFTVTSVPEPTSIVLLGTGLVMLFSARRRRLEHVS